MPIEREFKYVLYDPEKTLFDFLKNRARWDMKVLTQSYLSDSTRLRKVSVEADRNTIAKETVYFTFKKMVEDELIEIETEIGHYDYNQLMKTVEPGRIVMKTRFEWIESDNITWSVDYLWDRVTMEVYFVICEFETKYDIRTAPKPMHFIEEYLIHTDDGTYDLTSNALSDVAFAKEVMKDLLGS